MNWKKFGGLTGALGSVLFILVFTLEGVYRTGYEPRAMYISELALGPRGWIQALNFIYLGLSILFFSRGVFAEFKEKRGNILFLIIGACIFGSGFFTMDPATTPPLEMSWQGILHTLLGAIVFLLTPISCFVFFTYFREEPRWQSLQWWTMVAGIIITAAVVMMAVGPNDPPAAPNVFNEWDGLIQRIALITYLSWQFFFALKLFLV